MTKEEEDKIIEQANEILMRRSLNTIYFEETGGGGGCVFIDMYIVLPNGEMACYDNHGELSEFTRSRYDWRVFQADEIPKDLLFSFRHGGTRNLRAKHELGKYKWSFDDLEYDKMDEDKWNEEQRNIKTAIEQVGNCKTIGEVYEIYDKYLRNAHLPYEVIRKAFEICKYEPSLSSWVRGEIGMFAFEQAFVFIDIMKAYEEKNNIKPCAHP